MISTYQESWRFVVSFLEPSVSCSKASGFQISKRPLYLQVTEVFNFSQDDLLTEDVMILDTRAEVFVWMGQCVDTKEKQTAFETGQVLHDVLTLLLSFILLLFGIYEQLFFPQKYIEHEVTFEGLSPDVPLYKVSEGNEPCFFRTYFSWDNTRSVVRY